MIEIKNGHVKIEGERAKILAEYTSIIKMLLDDFSEEELKNCFKIAKMSEEELDNAIRNKTRDIIDLLFNSIFKQEGDR